MLRRDLTRKIGLMNHPNNNGEKDSALFKVYNLHPLILRLSKGNLLSRRKF